MIIIHNNDTFYILLHLLLYEAPSLTISISSICIRICICVPIRIPIPIPICRIQGEDTIF